MYELNYFSLVHNHVTTLLTETTDKIIEYNHWIEGFIYKINVNVTMVLTNCWSQQQILICHCEIYGRKQLRPVYNTRGVPITSYWVLLPSKIHTLNGKPTGKCLTWGKGQLPSQIFYQRGRKYCLSPPQSSFNSNFFFW